MKRLISFVIALSWIPLLFAGIRLLDSQNGVLIVEYLADSYQLADSGEYQRLLMPEADYSGKSGAPALPSLEFKVGIPMGAQVEYRVLSSTELALPLQKRLQPEPIVSRKDRLSHFEYKIDETLYKAQPQPFLQYNGEHSYRSYSYASFRLNPAQYDGHTSLKLKDSALIQIRINASLDAKSAPTTDALSRLALQSFLNPEEAQYWQHHSRNHIHYADFSRSPWWIRLETDKKGMYRINPSQLSSFPIAEIDPRSFRLFTTTGKPQPANPAFAGNEFKEVPIYVAGEADGRFDSEDYIVFYGGNRTGWDHNAVIAYQNSYIYHDMLYHNPYSENYVYWLTFAGSFDNPPLRMAENNSYTTFLSTQDYHYDFVHLETESQRRDRTGLIWYMTRLFGSNTQEYSFDIDLPDLMEDSQNRLRFGIIQEDIKSEQFHYISVYVNGVLIPSNYVNPEQHRWYSTNIYYFSQPSAYFRAGQNTIRIKVWRSGTPENFFLDYIRVDYKKALHKGNAQYAVNGGRPVGQKYLFSGDASNTKIYKVNSDYDVEILPLTPEAGGFSFIGSSDANNRYYISKTSELYSPLSFKKLEPTDIASVSTPVQSLIITPPLFLNKANELADFYRSELGLATKVVLLEDIFTQFNGGHPDPAAIRQYIKHLYYHAPEPRIQSLSLIGLGTLDWRNYSRLAAPKNHIPLYFSQESDMGLFSDDYYGMISTLQYPEIAIGRYPVSTVNELNLMLQNLKRYVQNPKPGLWRNSMLSLADDFVNGPSTFEYDHTQFVQELSQLLPPALLHEKIFGEEWEYDQFLNKPKVRDEMFRQINLGKLIWYYVGHGAFDALGQENYYTGSVDMDRFQNPDMLPLFIAASCDVSAYDHWAYQSLGEKSVLLNNRGAIASVAATTLSFPGPNHSLMKHFIRNMINDYLSLGASLSLAKMRYYGGQNSETYCILGDPNLYIVPPQRYSSISLQNYAATDTLHSRNTINLQGNFDSLPLSGEALQIVYDAGSSRMVRNQQVSKQGTQIFKGTVSLEDGNFAGGFILPDDLNRGADGMILAYHWDDERREDYLAYFYPMPLSDSVLPDSAANDGPPQISIYLGTYDFRAGDTVSNSPTLNVKIQDANGINLSGKSGHNILMVLDNSLQPLSLTDYFEYDTDSFTSGTLVYPLQKLSEGAHTLQIIAFDNYNLPAVASTHFISSKNTSLSIENFLIYPNPLRKDGYFSFIISEAAEITLDIFSPSGKRIRRIEQHVSSGFHAIPFDGKDSFGRSLANNTYFVRLKAKGISGKSLEKREKMVIYK